MNKTATVPFGEQCETEDQSRVCDDGVFGQWSGTGEYAEADCVVLAQWPPASGVVQLSERTGAFVVVGPSGQTAAWLAVDDSGVKAHAYWRLLTTADSEIVDLGETVWGAGSVAIAGSGVVAFVNDAAKACAGPAQTPSLPCFGSEVRSVALSADASSLAYATDSEIVVRHLASGAQTHVAVESPGRMALSELGSGLAYSAGGEVLYAAPLDATAVSVGAGFNPTLARRGATYLAFESLQTSSMHGPPPPSTLVEVPNTTEVTIAGEGSHIAYRKRGSSPNLVVVHPIDVGAPLTVLSADDSVPSGDCSGPSLSKDATVLGLTCEAYLAEDGSPVDGETIFSLPFVVWLDP